ncbi:MAG: hypothetical protein EPN77_19405 [Candidimonas sp.]|nr:MAG: hypothetical protein EPN77_19405 [Candidimonas sp.]
MNQIKSGARAESKPFVKRDAVGILSGRVGLAGKEDALTLEFAFMNFGFLIARNECLSLSDYAERIRRNYVAATPQVAEVLRVLHEYAERELPPFRTAA